MASDSWASAEIDPKLMAPVQNRLTIPEAGSTFIQRNWSARLEFEHPPQRAFAVGLFVDSGGKSLIGVLVSHARRRLNLGDGMRIPGVLLAGVAVMKLTLVRQDRLAGFDRGRDNQSHAAALVHRRGHPSPRP